MCGLLEYFHIFVHSLIFLPIRSFLPHPPHWWFRAIPICNGTALNCCTPVRLIQHAVGAEGHWRRPTVLESTKLASSLPPSVLCPAPPLASLPSPSGGAGHCCRPTMMEPAGRCGTRRLPAAGAAPPVDSSGSSRKVGGRWGAGQGIGGGGCKALEQAGARYGLPPSLLLLCFLPLGLHTNKLLPCPPIRVRGQEAPMVAQTPVATRLSGCIGKIGWLDLLHWVWKGGNWSITAQASPRWRHRVR